MKIDGRNDSIISYITKFSKNLKFNDIPDKIKEKAKLHILDAIGVALASASLKYPEQLLKAVKNLGISNESSAIGFPEKLPASSAALFNGILIHSLEYDDTHMRSVVHGSSVILSTALAISEKAKLGGEELIRSFVVGWEVLIRLGLAAPGGFQDSGFQGTSVCGPLASAVTSCSLLNLDENITANALGIAGSQSSGVFEFLFEGATVKSFHPGWASHAGIIASYLSTSGLTGPKTILEGKFGLYKTFTDKKINVDELLNIFKTLGENFEFANSYMKKYPCCHYIHSFIECIEQFFGQGHHREEIKEINCYIPIEECAVVCDPWDKKIKPATGYEAKFSLPYCLSAYLVYQDLDVDMFALESPDETILNELQKISFTEVKGSTFPEMFPAKIELVLTDGNNLNYFVPDVKGGPNRPFTLKEIKDKFFSNATRKITQKNADMLFEEIINLENVKNLSRLGYLLY